MEMNDNYASNNVSVLEISSDYVKFAIGSLIDKKPVLSYYAEESIRGAVKDGLIRDAQTIKTAILNLLAKTDESLKLKVNIESVSLVLPPFGLKIYQINRQTNVVSQTNLVDQIDIINVMNMVQKETIPNGTSIVDIIPDYYELDNQKRFWNAPVGEKSRSLVVCAKVHALPDSLQRDYQMVVKDSGLRIERMAVAPLASSALIATSKDMPHDYVLVDMGAHVTSVSMVGANRLFASLSFAKGGDDLTEAIASAFSLSFEEAERIKIDYGHSKRIERFIDPIAKSYDENGAQRKIYQEDLNKVISDFYATTFNIFLSNAINKLLERSLTPQNKDFLPSLPAVFVGGASELFGLLPLLEPALGTHKPIFYSPTVLGAREAKYSTVLGLIASQGDNRGRVDSYYRPQAPLSRTKR